MAKYSRYDPRNKKRGKNKHYSENKDHRIREIGGDGLTKVSNVLREVTYDGEQLGYDDEYNTKFLTEG